MECIVYGVAKSPTPLSDSHFTSLHFLTVDCEQGELVVKSHTDFGLCGD